MRLGLHARPRILALLCTALGIGASAQAQSAFDRFSPGITPNQAVYAMAVQADGKVLLGGLFAGAGGGTGVTPRSNLARITPAGYVDTTFNPGANNWVFAFAVQPDGKILVGGDFTMLGGGGTGTTARSHLGRLNADGSLDASFNPGANAWVDAIAIQADGKIVVGGAFTGIGGGTGTTPRNYIARLNADGSVDTTFNPGAEHFVHALALQVDSKILVGGDFYTLGGAQNFGLGRLNVNGTVDTTFRVDVLDSVFALAVQPDGQILVGGKFDYLGGVPRKNIGRVKANGFVDMSFDPGSTNRVDTLTLQPDGRIVVGGLFGGLGGGTGTTARKGIGRIMPSGSLDTTFDPGTGANVEVLAVAVQSDGQVLVSGGFTTFNGYTRNGIARLFPDGSVETDTDPGANASIYALAIQPDGKTLVGGAFTMLGGGGTGTAPRSRLARLNANGSLDTTFDPGAYGTVYALAVQPDGKILVGGAFTMLGGGGTGTTPRTGIGRLNSDGSLDDTFDPGANGGVLALSLQPNGRILVGGTFTMLGGGGTGTTSRRYLGRLNADGSLDGSFDPGANSNVLALVQAGSQILVGGSFTMLGGGGTGATTRLGIGRLNGVDGSLDASFDPGVSGPIAWVKSLATQPDGRILVGGIFTGLGGGTGTTPRSSIGRLNAADGSVDGTFDPGSNGAPDNLAVQTDGQIVVADGFTALGGGGSGTTTRFRIGRLSPSGSLDASFDPGANSTVFALGVQPTGKIILGGDFTQLGGGFLGNASRTGIGRLETSGAALQKVTVSNGGHSLLWTRSGVGPEVWRTTFESSIDGSTYTPLGDGTRVAGGWTLTGQNLPSNQNLWIRARGYYATGSQNGSSSIVESIRNDYVSCAVISPTSLPSGLVGAPYSRAFTTTGGLGIVTFGLTGTLPTGITFAAGLLAGTPTQSGSFPMTVTATDASSGCVASQAVTLTIAPATVPVITSHPSNLMLVVGDNGAFTVAAAAAPAPTYQWQISTNQGGVWTNVTNVAPYSGATTTTLSIAPASLGLDSAWYRAIATNIAGSTPSLKATLTVTTVVTTATAEDGFDPGADGDVNVFAIQSDGRILVGGAFTMLGGGGTGTSARNSIGRLYPDGSLDLTFDPGSDGVVNTIAVQPDGKILVGGTFTMFGGGGTGTTPRSRIARLNADGSLDSAFDPGANFIVNVIVVQPDGKILVAGWFNQIGGGGTGNTLRRRIARLNPDGSVDPGFNPGATNIINALALQPDGKIVVGGMFLYLGNGGGGSGTGSTLRWHIGRINADGSIDDAFDPGADDIVTALALQADGKILVAGNFTYLGGGDGEVVRASFGRLMPDGLVDPSFNSAAGFGMTTIIVQPDGKIVVGGNFGVMDDGSPNPPVQRHNIGRWDINGAVDPTFNPGSDSTVRAVAVQPDGNLLIGGSFTMLGGGGFGTTSRNSLGRVYPDGSLDTTFDPGANESGSNPLAGIAAVALQPDGKMVVAGAFTTIGGGGSGTTARSRIARLSPDGSVDASFDPGANAQVLAAAVQPDGKILVGGYFTMLGGGGTGTTSRSHIGRLNADGSLDTSFDPGASDVVDTIVVQPDGKILVGGWFTALGGGGSGTTSRFFLGRLNANGSLDTGFNPGANATDNRFALQPDGKIIVAGNFTSLGGGGTGTTPRARIGRLNDDGSLDGTFDPGANGVIVALVQQPDGKILVGGAFTMLGGGGTGTTSRLRVGRLNSDGSLDTGFNPGATGVVRSLALQTDGRIVVTGDFSGLGGGTGVTARNRIGRLYEDGSVDGSLNPGAGSVVNTVTVQPDGKVLAAGGFLTLGAGGTIARSRIGRLSSTSAASQHLGVSGVGTVATWLRSGAGPQLSRTTFEVSTDGAVYTPLGDGTRITGGWQLTGAALPANQNLFVRARGFITQTGALDGSGSIVESIRNAYVSCPTVAPASLSAGALGFAFPTTTFTGAGAIGAVTIDYTGALPTGMTFIGGALAGTPTQAGVFPLIVSATDTGSGCVASQNVTFTIEVGSAPLMTGQPLDQTVAGGQDVSFTVGASGVPAPGYQWQISTNGGSLWTNVAEAPPYSGVTTPTLLVTSTPQSLNGARYRATAFNVVNSIASASALLTVTAAPSTELVTNGDFTNGMIGWQTFATPTLSYINATASNGVMQFSRVSPPPGTSNQATVFRETGVPLPAGAPILAQFQLGNTSTVRKYMKVLLIDSDFSDFSACTFWLPPSTPLQTYQFKTHTTKAWANTAIYFYASTANAVSDFGSYLVDNVSVQYAPAQAADHTDCVDPLAPAPSGGGAGANMVSNGDFGTNALAPWTTFGTVTAQASNGLLEMIRPTSALPAGVVLQPTAQGLASGQILTASFKLGNSSGVRKRVTAIMHDLDFSDLVACVFWLSPGQVPATYSVVGWTSKPWANATMSFYAATIGLDQWTLVDDVVYQTTPGTATTGSTCIEPAGGGNGVVVAPPAAPRTAKVALLAATAGTMSMGATTATIPATGAATPTRVATATVAAGSGTVAAPRASEWISEGGFARIVGSVVWEAVANAAGTATLAWRDDVDLRNAAAARLTFSSWLTGQHSRAIVQVRTDASAWQTVASVSASDAWVPVDVDLAPYIGEIIEIRFAFDAQELTEGAEPNAWRLDDIYLDVEPAP